MRNIIRAEIVQDIPLRGLDETTSMKYPVLLYFFAVSQMPLSKSEVRSLEAGDKRKVVSVGDSHYVVCPLGRGAGRYFSAG